jgi:hypothetical protein
MVIGFLTSTSSGWLHCLGEARTVDSGPRALNCTRSSRARRVPTCSDLLRPCSLRLWHGPVEAGRARPRVPTAPGDASPTTTSAGT